jgi:hypothetical protein
MVNLTRHFSLDLSISLSLSLTYAFIAVTETTLPFYLRSEDEGNTYLRTVSANLQSHTVIW